MFAEVLLAVPGGSAQAEEDGADGIWPCGMEMALECAGDGREMMQEKRERSGKGRDFVEEGGEIFG